MNFESELSPSQFLERLFVHVEPRVPGFKLRIVKDFEGEVHKDGQFNITYKRGPTLVGNVVSREGGSLAEISVRLPPNALAFGLAFAWGIFGILLIGIIILHFTSPELRAFSLQRRLFGFAKQLGVISAPGLFTYGIFWLNLHTYVGMTREFFDENLKR